jgi:tetratricopeptide (TPR) repeat protein
MLLRALKDVFANLRLPAQNDHLLQVTRNLINQSRHQEAIEIATKVLKRQPDCVDALMLRGIAKRESGRPQEAVSDLARAAELAPDNAICLYELAVGCYASGDKRLALEHCKRARTAAPEFIQPFALLAHLKLSGEHYTEVMARIQEHMKPRTYVEIGVFRGDSLKLAKPPTLAVGIDPAPQLTESPAEGQKVFAETSDAFFAGHDLRAELGGLPVDLAFIDGMHNFEFAMRDFANLERYCTRDSAIMIHDCYPVDRESAGRTVRHVNWSGDIWRLIVLLKKYRPDLSVNTIGTTPTGLGLVRNLDSDSRFLLENQDRLREEFLALDYSYLDEDMPGKLNLFPNEWEKIRALVS